MENNTNENIETQVTEENKPGTEGQENKDQITLSQEELNALIAKQSQSEIDRRVTQAVKKVTEKYEKQLSLSKLDEDKRAVAEKDLRIQELEDQLREFAILQNKNEVTKTLSARGLSAEFADILVIGDDIDQAQQNIETLDKLFKKAVADEVKRKLAQAASTPSGGNGGDNIAAQRAEFKKKSLAEQNKLYQENPDLYKVLTE